MNSPKRSVLLSTSIVFVVGFSQSHEVCPSVKGLRQPPGAAINGQTISDPRQPPGATIKRDKGTDHFRSNGAQMGQKVCPLVEMSHHVRPQRGPRGQPGASSHRERCPGLPSHRDPCGLKGRKSHTIHVPTRRLPKWSVLLSMPCPTIDAALLDRGFLDFAL